MSSSWKAVREPVRVGVSLCLLGERVRHDGGHKHERFLTDVLGRYVEWVPVCPEVELGMGVPREPVHLVEEGGEIRLLGVRSRKDHTRAMREFARRRVRELGRVGIAGFVLKSKSPSCGLVGVPVEHAGGRSRRDGRGFFARALLERFPNLPVAEEGDLYDAEVRENWVERVFAYHRLQSLWRKPWRAADLVEFHRVHKLVLLAHSPEAYRHLGRLVARARELPRAELRARYEEGFMAALARHATRGRHANALEHAMGYFREKLDPAARAELRESIEKYRKGLLPLAVPLTLVAHYARVLDVAYLRDQLYLDPDPRELALRGWVPFG
ncbi:MAG: hypothetical protein KatS3mg076_1347 [Candidatus Binatia bacterium]|nr:MAG: hypothetical protein KatS3mg076_1347 [Candidatus Binatia bacterium]